MNNVEAAGGKPCVVLIDVDVLNWSGVLAFWAMPFRHRKLIRIDDPGDDSAVVPHLVCQLARYGSDAAGKIVHQAAFAEACIKEHSARGCAVDDLVKQSQGGRSRSSNIEQISIASSTPGALGHVTTPVYPQQ